MDNNDYWDDIDVGECDLNHSENFFSKFVYCMIL